MLKGMGRPRLAFGAAGRALCLAMALLFPWSLRAEAESTCYGRTALGRLENGVRLPASGANFSAYSALAPVLGRTYVHSRVARVVLAAYGALEQASPGKVFVYGETGWAEGGPFKPHRTHQNGLSVDFMVPVVDGKGHSVPLPGGVGNQFGYGIEFDGQGRYGEYRLDFAALAEHLYQLHRAAQAQGVGIAQVIFEPAYLPALLATPRGPYLRARLRFMKKPAWIRHDEHYHVDFAVPCQPMPRSAGAGGSGRG